jgi:hypothetical protein
VAVAVMAGEPPSPVSIGVQGSVSPNRVAERNHRRRMIHHVTRSWSTPFS